MNYSEQLSESTHFLEKKLKENNIKLPHTLVVLGSGLGPFADSFENGLKVKCTDIPHFKAPGVSGHAGAIVFVETDNGSIAFQQGRLHFYEGHDDDEVNFPLRAIRKLGAKNLIVTNAAGSLNPNFNPGDLIVIEDHINHSGRNPLIGPNKDEIGARFPDMSEVYSKTMRKNLLSVASELSVEVKTGTYFHVSGPSYETPAEIKMFRAMGGDMIGMSTVPEVIAAKHAGYEILGISCITNYGAGIVEQVLKHEDVKNEAQKAMNKFTSLIGTYLKRFS